MFSLHHYILLEPGDLSKGTNRITQESKPLQMFYIGFVKRH